MAATVEPVASVPVKAGAVVSVVAGAVIRPIIIIRAGAVIGWRSNDYSEVDAGACL